LPGALDNLLKVCAAVLAWVKALTVLGNACIINDGEAETAFASGQDAAIKGCEGAGEGANGILNLVLSVHFLGVS
jgi:hypothetical protein